MLTSGKFAFVQSVLLAGCLCAGAAFGQTPAPDPAPAPIPAPVPAKPPAAAPAKPADSSAKPAEKADDNDTLRIRGQIETVDAAGVSVQLSKGLSIRVDIAPETPVFSAMRISQGDLAAGADVGVRTLAPSTAGENSVAADVLSFAMPAPAGIGGFGVRGAYKSVDKSGEKPLLVVSEAGADRRLVLTNETAFWRVQTAQLADVKPGGSISVVIVREPSGHAHAQRVVFGAAPTGVALPL